jgi:hypothetical protein
MSARFIESESITLLGTWWGIIGCILGPIFILRNILEYVSGSFLITRDFVKLRLIRQSNQINQSEPGTILNMLVQSTEALVGLFKTADASTLIYNEGRRWLDQFLRDADDNKAPGELRDDAAAILNYVGGSRPDELTAEKYNKFLYRLRSIYWKIQHQVGNLREYSFNIGAGCKLHMKRLTDLMCLLMPIFRIGIIEFCRFNHTIQSCS